MTTQNPKAIGVIGFGIMGAEMAVNLAKNGYTVFGYSRTQAKVGAKASHGIISASLETIASSCQTVLLALTDGSTVSSVLFEQQPISNLETGLAPALARGALIIDTTTIAPKESRVIFTQCKELGLDFVDSPVSGGDIGARNGTLTCMVGAEERAWIRAQAILKSIGSNIVHVGPPCSGQKMKAINQVAVALGIVAMTEALSLTDELGIDRNLMLEVLQGGAAGSWALANYAPRIINGDLAPGFKASHMLKDLRIALSERGNTSLPATQAVTEFFERLVDKYPELGNHALCQLYGE
jgi:3-hydroxyisobutyrate dehydrogenase